MLFSSVFFLFYFLPVLIILYYLVPYNFKNPVLLIASLLFYSWGEPVYVFLMIFSIVFNYSMALDIRKDIRSKRKKRGNLVFALTVNLFILCFFKYYGFTVDTINSIFGSHLTYTALPLPIGISFYTFQAMSYIIDVYRGDIKAQRSLIRFALYLSLFPQLIAGPIVKYRDIMNQLTHRRSSLSLVGEGAFRFTVGLAKKVLLANGLGALHQQILALSPDTTPVLTFWLGALAYTLQIYFDFSGYSDMAIGLGKMFGFDIMENFNYPYVSKSITEFWRRWHISLSSWFREYLYIPLGGNRVSPLRHIFNLLVVWSLTGLWHGASWNFVAWGLYYGILLIIEKYLLGDALERWPKAVRHFYALFLVIIGWVFFFSSDISAALLYLKGMFFGYGFHVADAQFLYLLKTNFVLLLVACLFSSPRPQKALARFDDFAPLPRIIALLALLSLSVAFLIYSTYNPFLYFRF